MCLCINKKFINNVHECQQMSDFKLASEHLGKKEEKKTNPFIIMTVKFKIACYFCDIRYVSTVAIALYSIVID